MFRFKKKFPGLVWTSQAVLSVLLAVIMTAGMAYYASRYVDTAKAEQMTANVNMIGRALIRYSEAHTQVKVSDIEMVPNKEGDGKHMHAPTRSLYPKDQAEFEAIRNELGYYAQFSMNKDVDNDVFSKIRYSANEDRTDFKLEVTYPNGKVYTVTKKDFGDNGRADPQ